MINSVMAKAAEKFLNTALALDDDKDHLLQPLDGESLGVEVTNLNLNFYFKVSAGEIEVSHQGQSPTAILRGNWLDLVAIALSQNPQAELIQRELEFEGKLKLLSKIQTLIDALDLDLEAHLSDRFGPVPASVMTKPFQLLRKGIKAVAQQECQSWGEYLQHESGLLPSAEEVSDFYEEISGFAQDVDRLEARLKQLQ